MPQPKKAARFGGNAAHHNMIMANLATELFRHGRIETTLAKAKTVQPLAEKMITFAKRGDIHARRQVLTVVRDKDVVHKLFADIGPVFSERNGGYTRVLKLGPRRGDNAPMALLELVDTASEDGEVELTEEPRRRWSLRRSRGTVSTSAREREEDRAAAVDRGEGPDEFADDVFDTADVATEDAAGADVDSAAVASEEALDEATEYDGSESEAADAEAVDENTPEADAAEVEARLAAEDTADESAETPTADADEGDDGSDK